MFSSLFGLLLLPPESFSFGRLALYFYETSRTSLRQCRSKLLAGVQFPRSTGDCDSRICWDLVFR